MHHTPVFQHARTLKDSDLLLILLDILLELLQIFRTLNEASQWIVMLHLYAVLKLGLRGVAVINETRSCFVHDMYLSLRKAVIIYSVTQFAKVESLRSELHLLDLLVLVVDVVER